MLILSARARFARVALLEVLHQAVPALNAARRERNPNLCVADGRSSQAAFRAPFITLKRAFDPFMVNEHVYMA